MAISAPLRRLLATLSADDPARLGPDHLLAEARLGLQLGLVDHADRFPFGSMPLCQWAGGGEVPADLLRWWITLAWSLEQPGGTPLLRSYLSLLTHSSQAELGLFVLTAFTERDPGGALREAGLAGASAAGWGRPNNARGILALAAQAPELKLVARIRTYFRAFPSSWPELCALLEPLGASGSWPAIQFLLTLSDGYRLPSIQRLALAKVHQFAADRQLTLEQLADRTIPSAGFAPDGTLILNYGPRAFQATLEPGLSLRLTGPDGKVLKALPKPRRGDDPEAAEACANLLKDARSGVSQVRSQWKRRFYDAMCARTDWAFQDWQTWLLANPIVGRMSQRLVWEDDQGWLFRPLPDGTLVTVSGKAVTRPEGRVRLAHGSLISPEAALAWVRHGKAHGIEWVLDQLARPYPNLTGLDDPAACVDRLGWMLDARVFKGTLIRMGYERGATTNLNFFNMTKWFHPAWIQVEIAFSGADIGTWSHPVAMLALSFHGRGHAGPLELAKVPAVILAEGYADYLAVAQLGSGYAPDWRGKVPILAPEYS